MFQELIKEATETTEKYYQIKNKLFINKYYKEINLLMRSYRLQSV